MFEDKTVWKFVEKMISNITIFNMFCLWNVSCVQVFVSLDSFEFFKKENKQGGPCHYHNWSPFLFFLLLLLVGVPKMSRMKRQQ
jgi:hypothetical protein